MITILHMSRVYNHSWSHEKKANEQQEIILRLIRRWWTSLFRPVSADQFVSSFPGLFLTVRWAVPSIPTSTAGRKRFAIRCSICIRLGIVLFDNRWECFAFRARIGIVALECTSLAFTPEVIGSFQHCSPSSTSQSEINIIDRQFIARFQLMFATYLRAKRRSDGVFKCSYFDPGHFGCHLTVHDFTGIVTWMIQWRLQGKESTEDLIGRFTFQVRSQMLIQSRSIALSNIGEKSIVECAGVRRRGETLSIASDLIETIVEFFFPNIVTNRHGRVLKDVLHDFQHPRNTSHVTEITRGDKFRKDFFGVFHRSVVGVFHRRWTMQINSIRWRII